MKPTLHLDLEHFFLKSSINVKIGPYGPELIWHLG